MACDNLLIVHGRIGTLDIYVVAAMIWGAAFYLRGAPLSAGAPIGVGACFKLVAPYALLALALLELLRSWPPTAVDHRGSRGTGATASRSLRRTRPPRCFLGLLAIMDQIAPPVRPAAGTRSPAGRSRTSPTCSPTRRIRPAPTARTASRPTRGIGWSTTSRSST